MLKRLLLIILCATTAVSYGADTVGTHNAPGMGNPIVPGYYADPTVKKFGDTFYMYATTDGTAGGTGPSQVWVSKDFVNWTNLPMNWPTSRFIWAPEVNKTSDGMYYFYYSQPCQIHAGKSESPLGPWESMKPHSDPNADGMIVPNQYIPPVITLDWQTFLDDDGKRYGMFCTWGIFPKNGCGMVEVGPDMLPIDSTKWMIPNTELKDIFEAPYMIKKDGVYYMTYSSGSCHDDTYRVQYATATNIRGPYTYDTVNNPILSTNEDGTIHGPGHHSFLQDGDDYYIIYHRHDNPHSTHGMFRQIAADRLEFGPNNTLKKVVPTHTGIGYLGENTNPFDNLTLGKKITASSFYSPDFKPEYAVDDNNGTLWKAKDNTFPQSLEIDLGAVQQVKRTRTEFQYPNWYYQYLIEYSVDGNTWNVFSDKRDNQLEGCPMVDFGNVQARYLKLTITGLEKPGMYAAVWNFKAYENATQDPPQKWVHLEADDLEKGALSTWKNTKGMLAGEFIPTGKAEVKTLAGRKAVVWQEGGSLKFNKSVPETLKKNKEYSILGWVYSGKNGWQHVAVVAHADKQQIYLNGEIQAQAETAVLGIENIFELPVKGADDVQALASIKVYARSLHASEVRHFMTVAYKKPASPWPAPKGLLVDLNTAELNIGPIKEWKNKGVLGEKFVPYESVPMMEVVAGIKAVTFKGKDAFRSTFPTPKQLLGNSNYTVAVWAFNPSVEKEEFMVSWASPNDIDTSRSQLGFGSQKDYGATAHRGWADMGYKNVPSAKTWHHIAVTFDGSVEKIYVDGKLDNSEQKTLHAASTREMLLGRGYHNPQYFSGSLASVKMYDRSLSTKEIAELSAQRPHSEVLVSLNTARLEYGELKGLDNSGSLKGTFQPISHAPIVGNAEGRSAMLFEPTQSLALDTEISQESSYSIESFVFSNTPGVAFLKWEYQGNYSPAIILPPSVKTGSWVHLVQTSSGSYVNGQKVSDSLPKSMLQKGSRLIIGDGFKGAISKVMVFNRDLSEQDASNLYTAAIVDLEAPKAVNFIRKPTAVTLNLINMSASKTSDASGWIQYYFEEVTGAPGAKSSGWISSESYENWGLQADQEYGYTVKVRDYYGNVSAASQVVKLRTDSELFTVYSDEFDKEHDYLTAGTGGTMWDGLVTKGEKNMTVKEASVQNGKLRLKATGANIDGPADGPFLYKTVKGDFVLEAKVADFQGWAKRRPPGLLEPMIMVRVADKQAAGPGIDQVRSGIFPYWNCGNLWTSLDGGGRPQGLNGTGYNADLYLQIQRSGNMIYLRTSHDGKMWKQIPNTPIYRDDMKDLPLQAGVALSIGNDKDTGWVDFDWVRILVKKQ